MANDEGIYVVVTIADNGIVHAWGDGPAGPDPDELTTPFATRAEARRVANQFKRQARLEPETHGGVQVRVCKVLGTDPVEVKTAG